MIFRYFAQILLHRPDLYWTTYRIYPQCNVPQFFQQFPPDRLQSLPFFLWEDYGSIRSKIKWEHRDKVPSQLSGGQQQRTAIGRAIIKNPDILLCDEPTGALDYKTSKEILDLIERVNKKYGNTVILVTHNDAIKRMADRVIRLRDGMIRSDEVNREKLGAMQLDW